MIRKLLLVVYLLVFAGFLPAAQVQSPPCEQVRDEWAARWEITEQARSRLEGQLAATAAAFSRAQAEIKELRAKLDKEKK